MHADWCSLRLPYHNLPKRSSIIARCTDTIWLNAASTDPTIQNQRKHVPSVALFPPNFQPFATQCKTRRLLLRLVSRWLNVLFYWVLAALQEFYEAGEQGNGAHSTPRNYLNVCCQMLSPPFFLMGSARVWFLGSDQALYSPCNHTFFVLAAVTDS